MLPFAFIELTIQCFFVFPDTGEQRNSFVHLARALLNTPN
jgi:hypothetical protein